MLRAFAFTMSSLRFLAPIVLARTADMVFESIASSSLRLLTTLGNSPFIVPRRDFCLWYPLLGQRGLPLNLSLILLSRPAGLRHFCFFFLFKPRRECLR